VDANAGALIGLIGVAPHLSDGTPVQRHAAPAYTVSNRVALAVRIPSLRSEDGALGPLRTI